MTCQWINSPIHKCNLTKFDNVVFGNGFSHYSTLAWVVHRTILLGLGLEFSPTRKGFTYFRNAHRFNTRSVCSSLEIFSMSIREVHKEQQNNKQQQKKEEMMSGGYQHLCLWIAPPPSRTNTHTNTHT